MPEEEAEAASRPAAAVEAAPLSARDITFESDAESAMQSARRRAQSSALSAEGRPSRAVGPVRGQARAKSAAAWILLLIVIAGVLGSGFVFRDQIIATWPASYQIYHLAGIAPEPPGFGLKITSKAVQLEDRVFTIEGAVKNETETMRDLPPLQGYLLDRGSRAVRQWTIETSERKLFPGETVTFTTTVEDAPAEAVTYRIDFVKAGSD